MSLILATSVFVLPLRRSISGASLFSVRGPNGSSHKTAIQCGNLAGAGFGYGRWAHKPKRLAAASLQSRPRLPSFPQFLENRRKSRCVSSAGQLLKIGRGLGLMPGLVRRAIHSGIHRSPFHRLFFRSDYMSGPTGFGGGFNSYSFGGSAPIR